MRFFFIIFIGVLAIASSAILIKLCTAPAMVIAAYRLTLASLFFVTVAATRRRNPLVKFHGKDYLFAIGSGAFLCLHFATWITSLKYTSVASSTVLAATAPIFVGIGSALFLKERLSRLLIWGILITVTGAVIISIQEFDSGESSLFGNLLALTGAVGGAGYFLIGRILRSRVNTFDYAAVIYSITAIMLVVLALLMDLKLTDYVPETYLILFLIAFVPQVIGHTSLNWALKFVSATTVSVITLSEPISASILAFLFLGENITAIQFVGGILILAGVGITLRSEFSTQQQAVVTG